MKYLIVIFSLFFSACSLSPTPEIPKQELPAMEDDNSSQSFLLEEKWWENFNDSGLNAFVEEALTNNSDLQIAIIRVDKFREFLELKKAEQFPKIDAYGSAENIKTSDYTHIRDQGKIYDSYTVGAVGVFELDLWGKLRDAKRAAFEECLGEEYAKELVRQRVVADSVGVYYGLKSNKELYKSAKNRYESYKESYEYRKKQFEAGILDESVLLQEHSLMESALAESLRRESIYNDYKIATAILLGREPKEIYEGGIDANKDGYDALSFPTPSSLPSDILQRRADIKAAEAKIRASSFNIGVARAAFFPSISLSTRVGYMSSDLNSFILPDASTYSVGAELLTPIFDFGRLSSKLESAKSDQKIALLEYKDSVRKAFGEVKQALGDYALAREQFLALERRYVSSKKNRDLQEDRYNAGFSSYLALLEARREEFASALTKEEARFETLKRAVELYVSLGGGFKTER